MWLTAALSAIVFSVANTVRGEVERAGTAADGVRAHFLARGALERALLYVQWTEYRNPDGTPRFYAPGMPVIHLTFPNGDANVEIIPESSKLNVNTAPPQQIFGLLVNLGVQAEQARVIALAIADWRTPMPPEGVGPFDQFYLSRVPSFRARHASFEEIEEVLLVQGMTRELFYGTYQRDSEGHLVARPGLRECLSVYSGGEQVDVNTAQPAVMLAVGIAPPAVAAIVDARRRAPFLSRDQFGGLAGIAGPAIGRLTVGGGSIVTLRSTARLRLANSEFSDIRRTVTAVIKFAPTTHDAAYHILRWYDGRDAL